MPAARATVVVPVLNDRAGIEEVLRALERQTIRSELRVLAVDNGSDDGSLEVAEALADEAHSVTGGAGSTAARNLGVELARTPYLLTLDADTIPVDDRWAQAHLEALDAAPADVFGSAGPLITRPSRDPWAVRPELTPYPQFSADGSPLYAVNGSAAYRMTLVRSVGGYPNVGANDAGLGARARAAGYRFIWTPAAAVYHRNPEGLRGYYRQMYKVGAYAAELEPGELNLRWGLRQGRYIASQAARVISRNPRESSIGLLRAVAQTQGALSRRKSRR